MDQEGALLSFLKQGFDSRKSWCCICMTCVCQHAPDKEGRPSQSIAGPARRGAKKVLTLAAPSPSRASLPSSPPPQQLCAKKIRASYCTCHPFVFLTQHQCFLLSALLCPCLNYAASVSTVIRSDPCHSLAMFTRNVNNLAVCFVIQKEYQIISSLTCSNFAARFN